MTVNSNCRKVRYKQLGLTITSYTCLFFMQILELPQETNICSWVICIECQLDDEPCIIYKSLLSVMGVCLAIYYGFGPCFSCSSSTVQQSCKGSVRFILGSVPCLPTPNLFVVKMSHHTFVILWHAISGLFLVGLLFICTLIELVSMWNLTKVEIQLCNMLSPEGPKVSLDSYNWGLVSIPFHHTK